MMAGAAGGAASVLGGGKFANAALTSAFQYMYNQNMSARKSNRNRSFWDNPGAYLPSIPQGGLDAVAGFGDGVSFGLTDFIRDLMGTNGVVDQYSTEYGLSQVAGQLTTSAILVGGVMLRPFTAQTQVVTQWTTTGQLGANTRWVMTGGEFL